MSNFSNFSGARVKNICTQEQVKTVGKWEIFSVIIARRKHSYSDSFSFISTKAGFCYDKHMNKLTSITIIFAHVI